MGGDSLLPAARTLGAGGDDMSADALLARLSSVRRIGEGRWIARCPSHADRSPSLSIRETEDGRTLLHCFASCSIEEVLVALGLDFDALFPERRLADHIPRERRPFFPADVFEVARREIGVAAIITADMHKGLEISETDYARLFIVATRLSEIAGAAYANR